MDITRRASKVEAVPVILLIVGLLLSGCTDDSSTADDGSSADGSSSAPTSSDPSDPDGSQHLEGTDTPLAPGTYQFSFNSDPGVETPDALVEVPSGFQEGATWYVVSHDGDEFLGLWTIGQVDRDACLHGVGDAFDPGPSVEDVANALVAQKSTRASAPEPVTLAGHRGLYVELASPTDMSTCGKYPGLWRKPERGIYGDGQVDRLWVLDVDGQRLVVDASYGPQSTALKRNQLTSMVDSLEFVPVA